MQRKGGGLVLKTMAIYASLGRIVCLGKIVRLSRKVSLGRIMHLGRIVRGSKEV